MKPFRIGIDERTLGPLGLSPFETLDWAIMNEAEGVQFSGGAGPAPDRSFLRELAQYAEENRLYLEWGGGEYVPFDPATGRPRDIAAVNRAAAEQAHTLGVDTVCAAAAGPKRWEKGPGTADERLRLSARSLRELGPMLRDLGVTLALETQSAFTTFDLLRLFEMCDVRPGEYLGICLDTMNALTTLEDPAEAAGRVLPWVVTTHINDGATLLAEDGFVTFAAEAGTGVVDLETIIGKLGTLDHGINLSLEDHAGGVSVPAFAPGFPAAFPDLA
ncbi:MAG TPA: TIM barrel protein, partial [Acidobacteriota bacterium]|nr:TIM barrel protein [Acidobacteriota bacterium]